MRRHTSLDLIDILFTFGVMPIIIIFFGLCFTILLYFLVGYHLSLIIGIVVSITVLLLQIIGGIVKILGIQAK